MVRFTENGVVRGTVETLGTLTGNWDVPIIRYVDKSIPSPTAVKPFTRFNFSGDLVQFTVDPAALVAYVDVIGPDGKMLANISNPAAKHSHIYRQGGASIRDPKLVDGAARFQPGETPLKPKDVIRLRAFDDNDALIKEELITV